MKSLPWIVLAASAIMIGVAISRTTPPQDTSPTDSTNDRQSTADRLKELQELSQPEAADEFVRTMLEENDVPIELLLSAGDVAFEAGAIGLAERCLLRAHQDYPEESTCRLRLGKLLYSTGRIDEARRMWTPLLLSGGLDLLSLPMFGNSELKFANETSAILKARDSNDIQGRLAVAWQFIEDRRLEEAHRILSGIAGSERESDQFRHLWTLCLSLRGETSELAQWLSNPQSALLVPTPQHICLQGDLCRALRRTDDAIHCYAAAFELDPNCHHACVQLGELISQSNAPTSAPFFFRRADLIHQYETVCRRIHVDDELPSAAILQEVITTCENLSCLREALAWCTIAKAVFPQEDWMIPDRRRLEKQIELSDIRFSRLPELLASVADWKESPPDWERIRIDIASAPDIAMTHTSIRFRDVANDVGIDFAYDNGQSKVPGERHFFDFTGGGVAVLDMDVDGYPDLLFTQGGSPPSLGATDASQTRGSDKADHLYRNLRGTQYSEFASLANLVDSGYSQGCTAGDINLDGFPDLYVANIGTNQLSVNNGDGTFSSVNLPFEPKWTTSCAIADLTGDGIPDIYDVNHVTPSGVHQKMCRDGELTWPCDLSQMHAEQDLLLSGNGFGGFEDVSQSMGIEQDDGIGLGIAIADFDQSGALEIFVANDARANFLFCQQAPGGPFRQEAVMRGTALSAKGRAQACMGVAVGDANQDGQQDLFVTNFFADYNTLYRQESPGFFHDTSAEAGLLPASYRFLGFGTQFLDADLDGDLDLVVTNGDVADFSAQNP